MKLFSAILVGSFTIIIIIIIIIIKVDNNNNNNNNNNNDLIIIIIKTMIYIAQIPYNAQMRFTIKLHSPKIGYNN